MKRIRIDLHFVRDLVQRGILQVVHFHTTDQLVDMLTKPLSRARTQNFSGPRVALLMEAQSCGGVKGKVFNQVHHCPLILQIINTSLQSGTRDNTLP
jgi:hypothetical protein